MTSFSLRGLCAATIAIATLVVLGTTGSALADPTHTGGDTGFASDAEAFDLEHELAAKRGELEPRAEIDTAALAGWPVHDQALDAVAEASLPVLLPDATAFSVAWSDAHLTFGDGWYAASLTADGVTVLVQGSVRVVDPPGFTDADRAAVDAMRDDTGALISRTHGIVTASVLRVGVAYSIDVECATPFADARCTEDAFVRELVLGLARVAEVSEVAPAPDAETEVQR